MFKCKCALDISIFTAYVSLALSLFFLFFVVFSCKNRNVHIYNNTKEANKSKMHAHQRRALEKKRRVNEEKIVSRRARVCCFCDGLFECNVRARKI